ncbi:MAG: sigma-70 family RNA polymerase sigma factor [Gemmataceae bacterium]|nr:sigma-70 family RNA polymerase sigma factor [Gemmataceae bacterium]
MPSAPARRLFPSLRRVVVLRDSADRPDADLLAAFVRDRDADAFAALVRRHGPMVLGVCRRVVGDVHAADDAFQAVFLVLARRAAAVRPRAAVGNWLYGVAYRTALKARAVRARRHARFKQVDAMPEPPAPPPSDPWTDLRPVIDEELARLPDKYRLPVVLCDLEGRPQRAVAKHLGVAPATLAGRLAQARRTLAARLTRRGVALSGGAVATLLTEKASAGVVGPALADGVVRAAEAVAAGGVASGFVSAHAVNLCEGVMRMMLLSKLKAVGAGALAVLALSGGLGYGPGLVRADDAPQQGADAPRSPKNPDAAFLDRLSTELRGDKATPVEHGYFANDPDAAKRKKVVAWFLADDAVKAHQARKHGAEGRLFLDVTGVAFAPDGTRLAATGADGAVVVWDVSPSVTEARTGAFLLGDVVNSNAGVAGSITLNERNFDATTGRGVVDLDNDGRPDVVVAQPAATEPARGDVVVFKYPEATVTRGLNYLKRVQGTPPAADPNQPAAPQAELSYFLFRDLAAVNPDAEWLTTYLDIGQPAADPNATPRTYYRVRLHNPETDEAFLERATKAARGTAPSEVEKKYFAEDKDPKKRAKLLDLLLKDPAVAKKLGDDWKKGMLAPPATTARLLEYRPVERLNLNTTARLHSVTDGTTFRTQVRPLQELPTTARLQGPLATYRVRVAQAQPDKFGKLVDALLEAKKTDEQVLEAVTLAAAGRLPTDPEKRLVLATIGKAADRKAAWVEVAKALAPAEEKKDEPKK